MGAPSPFPSWLFETCTECGRSLGDPHWPGCSSAELERDGGLEAALGECRLRGWAVAHDGNAFRPCHPDELGAYADLDRYTFWLRHGDAALHGEDAST